MTNREALELVIDKKNKIELVVKTNCHLFSFPTICEVSCATCVKKWLDSEVQNNENE